MSIKYVKLGKKGDQIHRRDDGKKYIGDKPIAECIPKWSSNTNIVATLNDIPDDVPCAVHLGESGLIAIDFDDRLYDSAITLDSELAVHHQCQFISKSIGKDGGHFIYKYRDNLLTEYIANPNGKKKGQLDVLYGNTLLFVSNSANTIKQTIVNGSNRLNIMPLAMQQLLIARYAQLEQTRHQPKLNNIVQGTKLAQVADLAMKDDKFLQIMLRIITPARYKEILQESRKPLWDNHPDRLPETESAHMYMVSLSGVLMLDESIEPTLHKRLLHHINSYFSSPLTSKRVDSIFNHDMHSEQYCYDSEWMKKSFIVTSREGAPLEVFMYTVRGQISYLVFNHLTHNIETYASSSAVIDYLASTARLKVPKPKLVTSATHVQVVSRPDEAFGHNHSKGTFNTYTWNREQEVFYDPTSYKNMWSAEEQSAPYDEKHPRYPRVTLAALESSVGSQLYTRFLPFMRRKYSTRDHSPLFFVFFGVPHSFKSAIVNGVFAPLSQGRYRTLGHEVITDKYNDWMVDTDLVLVDEVHHLPNFDRAKLIKAVNEISGNKIIAGVRRMHQSVDSRVYPQEITFILTTNQAVQLTTEARDRRMVVFKSLTRVADALGMSNADIERNVTRETIDFAYYLASEVQPLEGDLYITNADWKNDDYSEFQENAQGLEARIAKTIDDDNLSAFIEVMAELSMDTATLAKCIYKPSKGDEYKLRLYNTREEKADITGIFNEIQVDISAMRKYWQVIKVVTYNAVDYHIGSSIRTGSKKTEWKLKIQDIPAEVLRLVNMETVEALDPGAMEMIQLE